MVVVSPMQNCIVLSDSFGEVSNVLCVYWSASITESANCQKCSDSDIYNQAWVMIVHIRVYKVQACHTMKRVRC